MLQANKVLRFARSSKKILSNLPNINSQHRISNKTAKSKLLHGLQSHIEPTLDWPCSAAHTFDVNAITTEHNSFSCHLQGSDGTNIRPGTKGRACWFCHL